MPPPPPPQPEDDSLPPWEMQSGHLPRLHLSPEQKRPPEFDSARWELDQTIDQSFPGTSIEDFTGTGKVAAVVPLRVGDSAWSQGIRAPRREVGRSVQGDALGNISGNFSADIDDQPSVQMRALRTGAVARATLIITAALLLSRVLGLLRTTLFAATFGNNRVDLDAFTNAFTVPDMIFNVVSGGALASAFIPIFAGYLIEKRDKRTAWHVASAALNLTMLMLVILAVLGIIFAPQFLDLTMHPVFTRPGCQGPGPHPNCEGTIVVHLTRIMLLQPIFLGGATIMIAVLQARQSFVLPALGQVIYTGSLIGGIMATRLDPALGIAGPAWGVVIGGVLQFVIQIPGLIKAKMHYRPTLDVFHPGIRQMFLMMGPRVLNSLILFVSIYVNRDLLTGYLSDGAVFGYVTAFTLILMPEAIIAQSVAQAAFPTMAAFVAGGEWDRLRDTITRTLRGIAYLSIPASLGIIVLAQPIATLIVGHGSFHLSDIPLVAQPLLFFAVGLTGLALVEILTRSFYALHNTRTPVEVSIIQFLFGIGLSLILIFPMGAGGVALANSISWLGEALVLLIFLSPRIGGMDMRSLGVFLLNTLAAGVVCALAALLVYVVSTLVLPITETSTAETVKEVVRLAAAVVAGLGAFLAASRFLGIEEMALLNRMVRRVIRR